ncbi:putative exosome complex component RRP41 [Hypsibius exemplaris]|uniref:Exosome complex component RRP41 n=1 Tax=Hypsibius exemplaris TaxID=2072580 RepID=A0A1W0WS37_HYPEX|nr:putative exosome complex component RRP41 [Hypsibius exemplaris]
MELISPLTGLRRDGRREDEIRDIKCHFGVAKDADGSVLFEQGNTKILATVFGPSDAGENDDDDGDLDLLEDPSGLECEFKLSAFSQQDRRTGQGDDPRADEYSEYMEMCYKVVMFPHKNENSVVKVTCQVLQADGSHLAAALTAGTLALIDAGIQIKDLIVGCTTTIIDGKALVDISSHEELQRLPQVTVGVIARSGEIIVMDMKNRFHKDLLNPILAASLAGSGKIFEEVEAIVREHVKNSAPNFTT